MNCTFCDIIGGTLPAEVLYEDERVIAILDINPIHFGHALVIPRTHCTDFLSIPQEDLKHIMHAGQKVANALVKSFDLKGFNIFSNNGAIAGQSVFHFHLHITPRYANDNIRFVLQLKHYESGEAERYGRLIRDAIQTSKRQS